MMLNFIKIFYCVVLVIGLFGVGCLFVIKVFEDFGFEVIDNLLI